MSQPIRDDDMVQVPRGLLAAARYAIRNKVDSPNIYAKLGDYALRNGSSAVDMQDALDEELATVAADRDIKAANLQLLVEKVLEYNAAADKAVDGGGDIGDIADAQNLWLDLIGLARGLKQ